MFNDLFLTLFNFISVLHLKNLKFKNIENIIGFNPFICISMLQISQGIRTNFSIFVKVVFSFYSFLNISGHLFQTSREQKKVKLVQPCRIFSS